VCRSILTGFVFQMLDGITIFRVRRLGVLGTAEVLRTLHSTGLGADRAHQPGVEPS